MNKTTILIVAVLLVIGGTLYYSGKHTMDIIHPEEDFILKTFSSYTELEDFLKSASEFGGYDMYGLRGGEVMMEAAVETAPVPKAAQATGAGAEEYSTTNIQVEGVDEADIVKNDGKYIYVVSGSKVVIVDAYPAENANVLSEIEFKGVPSEIFINKDRLTVFGQKQEEIYGGIEDSEKKIIPPYPRYEQRTFINIYDISDREDPKLVDDIALRGNYFDSRMVGDYVYLIANENVYYRDGPIPMPLLVRSGVEKEVPVTDIMYCPYPDYSYRYTNILAINTQDKSDDVTHKAVLTGNTQNLYMSMANLYLTSMKRRGWIDYRLNMLEKAITPLLPTETAKKIINIKVSDLVDYKKWNKVEEVLEDYTDSLTPQEDSDFNKKVEKKLVEVQREWAKESEKTVIHRISVDKGSIEYEAEGEVPGRVLNQFSMDEYENHFRIATTVGHASTRTDEETSSNNVYVLDMDLKVVGMIEDLALGEKIYSARFMGKRCYLVTFRNIDPLFVIDLADPENPKVLGKLKIPGYSDYLHPYDEDHLIGFGKWTLDAKDRDFAWYQGVKISLFDVSDVSKPKEVAKYELGDRGTDSYALHDHKAFLFDKDRNLLVIPVLLAEIDEEQYPQGLEPWQHGDYTFQGAYVFSVDLDDGFVLKGRVTHIEDDETFLKSGYYYYNDAYSVKRSLYMDDVLYTISGKIVKMNKLNDLDEVNKVELPYEVSKPDYYPGPVFRGGLEVVEARVEA